MDCIVNKWFIEGVALKNYLWSKFQDFFNEDLLKSYFIFLSKILIFFKVF